jgi:hypothetical protein
MCHGDVADDGGGGATARSDDEEVDVNAQAEHHARRSAEAAADERLHSAGDLRSADVTQDEVERVVSSSSSMTTTTTGAADQGDAMADENDRRGAEGDSEQRRRVEEHREDRELYLAKLETLHRLSRKVRAIQARGSTRGRDPLPEIGTLRMCVRACVDCLLTRERTEYLEELNRLEEKRVRDGWPLADLDYDEFEDEDDEGQAHDLRHHRRHTAAGKEDAAGGDEDTDPAMRELYALQQEIARLLALPKSARACCVPCR